LGLSLLISKYNQELAARPRCLDFEFADTAAVAVAQKCLEAETEVDEIINLKWATVRRERAVG
jgi:hypothetical protein